MNVTSRDRKLIKTILSSLQISTSRVTVTKTQFPEHSVDATALCAYAPIVDKQPTQETLNRILSKHNARNGRGNRPGRENIYTAVWFDVSNVQKACVEIIDGYVYVNIDPTIKAYTMTRQEVTDACWQDRQASGWNNSAGFRG